MGVPTCTGAAGENVKLGTVSATASLLVTSSSIVMPPESAAAPSAKHSPDQWLVNKPPGSITT
jgi:hypothetical protein